MSKITTYSGKKVNPLQMTSEDVDILDIAHALSFMTRANGHFQSFYSVAQHSINCALEAKQRGYSKIVQLACLLHDGSEAYLSDITRPVKPLLPKYLEIEDKLQNKIYKTYIKRDLTDEELQQVKQIDDILLVAEFDVLMKTHDFVVKDPIQATLCFETVDFKTVEEMMINLFKELSI